MVRKNKNSAEVKKEINYEAYLKYFDLSNKGGEGFRIYGINNYKSLDNLLEGKIKATKDFFKIAVPETRPRPKYIDPEEMLGDDFTVKSVCFNTERWSRNGKNYYVNFEEYVNMGKPDKININETLTFTRKE